MSLLTHLVLADSGLGGQPDPNGLPGSSALQQLISGLALPTCSRSHAIVSFDGRSRGGASGSARSVFERRGAGASGSISCRGRSACNPAAFTGTPSVARRAST